MNTELQRLIFSMRPAHELMNQTVEEMERDEAIARAFLEEKRG